MDLTTVLRQRNHRLKCIYLVLNAIIVALIIFSLLLNDWVRSDANESISYKPCSNCNTLAFDFKSFKGGILAYTDKYLSTIYKKPRYKKSYNDMYYHTCKGSVIFIGTFNHSDDNQIKKNKYFIKTICSTLHTLWIAGAIKVTFDALTIVLLLFLFLFIFYFRACDFCFGIFLIFTFCFLGCFFYFIGSFYWFWLTSSSFTECDKRIPNHGEKAILCATDGPTIVISTMIILFIFVLSFLTFGLKSISEYENYQDINRNANLNIQNGIGLSDPNINNLENQDRV